MLTINQVTTHPYGFNTGTQELLTKSYRNFRQVGESFRMCVVYFSFFNKCQKPSVFTELGFSIKDSVVIVSKVNGTVALRIYANTSQDQEALVYAETNSDWIKNLFDLISNHMELKEKFDPVAGSTRRRNLRSDQAA